MDWVGKLYLILVPVMSLVTFTAYGLDKRRAVSGRDRIRERTLHLFALLGGWPGALLGQRFFRHKTIKFSFRAVLWLIVAVHVGLVVYVLWAT